MRRIIKGGVDLTAPRISTNLTPMDTARPDDISAMLESVCNLGRSSLYGLRRRRILGAARHREKDLASPLKSTDAREAARRARALRLSGRDAEAEAGFVHAVALDPRCAEAVAFQWESRWSEKASLSGIDRAVSLEPREARWRVWRGLAQLASRGDAKKSFAEALALEESALAWAGLALAELEAGRARAAVAACGRAIEKEPAQGWLYRLRAKARFKAGDEKGFLEDCRRETLLDEGVGTFSEVFPADRRRPVARLLAAADRFLTRRPKAHWMLVVRGDCRRSPEINDFAGAVADFQAAAALAPDCAFTHAYLCRALMVAGRTDEARAAADRAIALAPRSGWMRVWRGELRRRLGDNAGSLADFDEGLRLDPDYEMGYAWRGGARRALGRLEEAVADLDIGAALDPAYAWSFAERSLAQRALGRLGPALRDLEAAARLDSKYVWCARPQNNPEAVAQLDAAVKIMPGDAWAWAWRGETRLRLGDAEGAARDLRRATALGPKLGWPRAWLGQALALAGRSAEAMRAFNAAVALDPQYPPALAERGRLLLSRGNIRAAWKDLSRAAAAGPLSARTWQSKGEAALSLRLWTQAVEDFSKALELERGWRPRLGRAAAYAKLGLSERAREDLLVPLEEARRHALEGRPAEAAAVLAALGGAFAAAPPRFDAARERAEMTPWLGETGGRGARASGELPWILIGAAARKWQEGDLAGAGFDADAFQALHPRSSAGPAMKALLAAQGGDRVGAERWLASCGPRGPKGWALALRGLLRSRWGDLDGAREDLEATRRGERSAWAAAERADVYNRSGQYWKALDELENLRRLMPRSAEPLARAATIHLEQAQYQEAAACIARARRLDLKDAALPRLLSRVRFIEGDWEGARRACEDARRLSPEDIGLRQDLLRLCLLLDDERAVDAQLAQPWPQGVRDFWLGYRRCRQGRFEESAGLFAAAEKNLGDRQLSDRAAFYRRVARVLSQAPAAPPLKGRELQIVGLGFRHPYQASAEALWALRRSEAIYSNLSDAAVADFLGLFGVPMRAIVFRRADGQSTACARVVMAGMKTLRRGAVATRGQPVYYGRLARRLVLDCARAGVVCKVPPSVSIADYFPSLVGRVRGERLGLQVRDTSALGGIDRRLPVLLYNFTSGARRLALCRRLKKLYAPGDPCWLLAGSGHLDSEARETTFAALEPALMRADAAVTLLLPGGARAS